MKDSENKKVSFLVEDDDPKNGMDATQDGMQNKADKLKKPIIFALMGVVFLGCMYLIFKPSSDKKTVEDIGLNDAVPQASDAGFNPISKKLMNKKWSKRKCRKNANRSCYYPNNG